MEIRQISLNDWVLAGGGAQGESYNHKSDSSLMLKLFGEQIDRDEIIAEVEISRIAAENGVPCPKPGELVQVGNRLGIIFQRILNKKSFCTAIAHDPSLLPDLAVRMANMARNLHSTPATDRRVPCQTDFFARLLDRITYIQGSMRQEMENAIDIAVKNETHTLLHGDFHYGNIITDGTNDYFIDLGAFSYGHPYFDLTMLYFTAFFADEERRMHDFHINGETTRRFWEHFKPAYFGADAKPDKELCHEMQPYFLLRTLFFDSALGHLPVFDQFREMILTL